MVHQSTPPLDASSPDGNVRKRVCKACDRCRLKKSKCDGASPCGRCKSDNAICVFGERKKAHDKVYPKGYVEMLEQQQAQLVSGLQELYRRTQQGNGWPGSPLRSSSNGYPLTHDILERLGALKQEGHHGEESFEEDLALVQKRLISNGSGYMQRQDSSDGGSDSDHSPTFPPKPMPSEVFNNSNNFPPTPPNRSPHQYASHRLSAQSKTQAPQTQRQTYCPPSSLQGQTNSNPVLYQRQQPCGLQSQSSSYEDCSMDFMKYNDQMDTLDDFQPTSQFFTRPLMDESNPCLPMQDWGDEDEFKPFFTYPTQTLV